MLELKESPTYYLLQNLVCVLEIFYIKFWQIGPLDSTFY